MERDQSDGPMSEQPLAQHNGSKTPGTNGTHPATGMMIPYPHPTADKEISLDYGAVLSAFRRRWFLAIALGLMFGSVSAAAAWHLVPAPFTAFSELRIDSVAPKILFKTADVQAVFQTYKQTQQRLIKSPFVLNAALRKKTTDGTEIAKLHLIQEQDYRFDWLREQIDVSSPATEFLKISLSGDHPAELAALVNAITDAYMEEVVFAEKTVRRKRLTELEVVQRGLEEQLRFKQNTMKDFAKTLGTNEPQTLTARQQSLLEFYSKMRGQAVLIGFELEKAKAKRKAVLEGSKPDVNIKIPDFVLDLHIANEPEFQALSARITPLETHFEQLKRIVNESSPKLREAQEKLTETRASLELLRSKLQPAIKERLLTEMTVRSEAADGNSKAALDEQIDFLEVQKEHFEAEVAKQESDKKAAGIISFEMAAIQSEIDQKQAVYKTVCDEISRLEIELGVRERVHILQPAQVPHKRETKKRYTATALAGLGVFAAVLAGIIWLEYRTRRISEVSVVANELNIPVIGCLPILPRRMINGSTRRHSHRNAHWQSALIEAIDAARTVLIRNARVESTNVIMFASAGGGEGKTTLTCHLATSLARAGQRTLVLDGDLRRPSVHKVFDRPLTPGWCEALRGEAQLDELVQSTSVDGLSLISAGKIDQQVMQILARGGAEDSIKKLKREYDFVIVDSSPLLPVTDGLMLGQCVDLVLFAILRDVSRVSKVAAASQKLAMLEIPLMGAFVIGLDDTTSYQRNGYQYGSRYGNASHNAYSAQPTAT